MVWVSRWFDFIREFSPWSSSSLYIWKQGVLLIDIFLVRNCPYSKDNHIPDQNSRKKSSLYPYPKAMHLQVVELLRCNLFVEMLLTQNSILIWVTYALWLVSPNTYETSFVFFRNKQLYYSFQQFQTQLLILIRMLVVLQNLLPRLDFCCTWTRLSFCKKMSKIKLANWSFMEDWCMNPVAS